MGNLTDNENKVINFIDLVDNQKKAEEEENAFKNTTDYKLRCLDNGQEEAKNICLDKLFANLYKNALPLNDDYKVAHADDLDADISDFMNDRSPKGMVYYIREGIKKGSKIADRMLKGTEDIVNDDYNNKAMNLEDYNADDMVFRMNDDTQKKLDVMNDNLELNDISQVIHDNVKNTAISEIQRAKKEKEDINNLEKELANDINVTTKEAVNNILELRGYTESKTFEPTLFQGIMIGKLNEFTKMQESGRFDGEYTFNTLTEYGLPENDGKSSIEEMAFIESVKEYTKLNILKALKLESFDKYMVSDLANEYAYTK